MYGLMNKFRVQGKDCLNLKVATTKGKRSNFTVEKPGSDLSELTSSGTKWNCVTWQDAVRTHCFSEILAKVQDLNLIMRKHQTNPIWGTFYKLSGLRSSSSSFKIMKVKARLRNYFILKEINPFAIQTTAGTSGETWMGSECHNQLLWVRCPVSSSPLVKFWGSQKYVWVFNYAGCQRPWPLFVQGPTILKLPFTHFCILSFRNF